MILLLGSYWECMLFNFTDDLFKQQQVKPTWFFLNYIFWLFPKLWEKLLNMHFPVKKKNMFFRPMNLEFQTIKKSLWKLCIYPEFYRWLYKEVIIVRERQIWFEIDQQHVDFGNIRTGFLTNSWISNQNFSNGMKSGHMHHYIGN